MKNIALLVACLWCMAANGQEKKIDYALHSVYNTYYAIIKPMVPAKDDYKAYCRYVVKDIVKKEGSSDIVVIVFDNAEAYRIYTSDNIRGKSDFIDRHEVGLYGPSITGGNYNELCFYEDCLAMEKYKGRERL